MSKRYPGGIIRKTPQTPSQTSAQGIWDMASVTQAVKENTWPIAGVPDPISRSLRFRSSASAYLNRTPASAGNRKTWTFSAWIKRGTLGSVGTIIHCYDGSSSRRSVIQFNSDNTIGWDQGGSGTSGLIDTVAVYRDPSAWYHLVCVANYSNGTAANRALIYVNGVLQAVTTADDFDNDDGLINSTNAHQIGSQGGSGNFFDGYMTEVYLIDGQALTPSSFGTTDDQTGVWEPIAYTGTYGTNGFYLPFSNTASTSTLGNDFSGNSNNWTTNNISLTSGTTYDSMVDVPTQWIPYNTAGDTGALWRGNYCVLNPLDKSGTTYIPTISNGNLSFAAGSAGQFSPCRGTQFVSSGKWYFEVTITNNGTFSGQVGVANNYNIYQSGGDNSISSSGGVGVAWDGRGLLYYTGASVAFTPTFTTNDVISCAFDADTGKTWFRKNGGSWYNSSGGTTGDPTTGANPVYTYTAGTSVAPFANGVSPHTQVANFGQRPFAYTPPSGFLTLNTRNLPTPTIGTTSTTQAADFFDATLYTGNGSSLAVTNSGSMQPDFVWIKSRSNAYNNVLNDSVRGISKWLISDSTDAEQNFATYGVTAFNANGFTVGLGTGFNGSGATYVGWQWRASNATAVTNTAGSITSTVSANTSAGFSIVTYTGSGSAATVGHGLGVAPSMIIVKDRDNGTYDWNVYHASLSSPTTLKLYLNLSDAENNGGTNSGTWNSTAPTSTVFSLGTFLNVNKSGDKFVAYCFSQVAGYSAFGSYTGNGSSDGPFIFTGFRPRFLMLKRTDSTSDWLIIDSARNTYNAAGTFLYPNLSNAEDVTDRIDFVSNGFKLRTTAGPNNSGSTYIYMAVAESPFKYALAR